MCYYERSKTITYTPMEEHIPVQELARIKQHDAAQMPMTTEAYMSRYCDDILLKLQKMGYGDFRISQRPGSGKSSPSIPGQPEILAIKDGRKTCICLGCVADTPMGLTELSEEQCDCCDRHLPSFDVYYAALLADTQEQRLYMVGPVLLKSAGKWITDNLNHSQFLPLDRRDVMDRYSPIFGGGVLFKMDKALIPCVLERGEVPRFAVTNLFTDQEQGGNGYYALMYGQTPTHLMLVRRDKNRSMSFLRPFFFDGAHPCSELELTRCLESPEDSGITELMDKTGRVLYAECLEAVLFPKLLATGRHYKWTLNLVADQCRLISKERGITSGPLYEQAKKEYAEKNGATPPPNFALKAVTDAERTFFQEPKSSYISVCARISRIDEVEIDGQKSARWILQIIPQNSDVEVQAFVGMPLYRGLDATPQVGNMVECSGYLYASPDEALDTSVSWQDSGEVAVMQEKRELEEESLSAYRSLVEYCVAHAVIAAACARAGLTPVESHAGLLRTEPTYVVQDAEGNKALLFVDTQIGEAKQEYHYTAEQMETILSRKKGYFGTDLKAWHCIVRLTRKEGEGNRYAISLETQPECPLIPLTAVPEEITSQAPEDIPQLSEAVACRLTCNAICTQNWNPFARFTHEDFTYTSLVNGTKTTGKMEFIRYMVERKMLWEKQQAWPGIKLDTGTIIYEGKRRPCYMISCYGHNVGAAVVTVKDGMISDMITLPMENNSSFEKDAVSASASRIFHPLRGSLSTFSTQQSPLQSFTSRYLQECMTLKTGFRGITGMQGDTYVDGGMKLKLHHNGARWVKLIRHDPSFCDMAFTYSGKLYAICAVETPLHPDNGGDIHEAAKLVTDKEQLLRMAERYNLIPCIFPVQQNHSPRPAHTWNLWDLRTLEPVTPQKDASTESAPPSEWEILNAAIEEVIKIVTYGGGRMIACHDTPDLLPHVWCYDPEGRLNWFVIRPHLSPNHADRAPSDAELLAKNMTPEATGFIIDAEPYEDEKLSKPATTREDTHHVKIGTPLPLA